MTTVQETVEFAGILPHPCVIRGSGVVRLHRLAVMDLDVIMEWFGGKLMVVVSTVMSMVMSKETVLEGNQRDRKTNTDAERSHCCV